MNKEILFNSNKDLATIIQRKFPDCTFAFKYKTPEMVNSNLYYLNNVNDIVLNKIYLDSDAGTGVPVPGNTVIESVYIDSTINALLYFGGLIVNVKASDIPTKAGYTFDGWIIKAYLINTVTKELVEFSYAKVYGHNVVYNANNIFSVNGISKDSEYVDQETGCICFKLFMLADWVMNVVVPPVIDIPDPEVDL